MLDRTRKLLPLAAIVLVGTFAALSIAEPGTESGTGGANGRLSDDDGGIPLFAANNLSPGERTSSCVRIGYSGSGQEPVTLSGRGSGPLDQYLDLEIEGGGGGAYGNCAGFSGTSLFKGTLAEFLRTGGDSQRGIPAWTATESEPSRTFRISVALRDVAEAQGQSASATFEWTSVGEDEPSPGGPDTSPGGPGTSPETPPAATLPATAGDKPHVATRRPHQGTSHGPVHRSAKARLHKGGYGSGISPIASDKKSLLDAFKDIVIGTGKRIAFPSILALLAFLFILVQNRLDRRDPKLALAPVNRDPDLVFSPLPWGRS